MGNNPLNGTSLRENALFFYVKKCVPDAIHRHKFANENKSIECDIYCPSLNLAIEYDGGYWHRNKIERDNVKNSFLNQNGIYVIRVREHGLPPLEHFHGIVIDLPRQHINEPETYDFINLPLQVICSRFKQVGAFEFVNHKTYMSDLTKISSLIYHEPVYPNRADMCGIKYWDGDRNEPIKPEYIPAQSWVYSFLKCPEGRSLLLPRYRLEFKSKCESRGSKCEECLFEIFCPFFRFCKRDNPDVPLHCEHVTKQVWEYIKAGKSIKEMNGKYAFSQWAFHVSDLGEILYTELQEPLEKSKYGKSIIYFWGDYYDNANERIARVGSMEFRYKLTPVKKSPLGCIEIKEGENMACIRAGRYVFGKNIPEGMYDLRLTLGKGMLEIYYRNKSLTFDYMSLGENEAKGYSGLDSEDIKYFILNGNLEVEITKSKMLEIE